MLPALTDAARQLVEQQCLQPPSLTRSWPSGSTPGCRFKATLIFLHPYLMHPKLPQTALPAQPWGSKQSKYRRGWQEGRTCLSRETSLLVWAQARSSFALASCHQAPRQALQHISLCFGSVDPIAALELHANTVNHTSLRRRTPWFPAQHPGLTLKATTSYRLQTKQSFFYTAHSLDP